MEKKSIPRMATIKEAAKLTGLSEYFVRQLVLQRKIVFVMAGCRYLVNVDKLIDYLNAGDQGEPDEVEMLGGIRQIAE